MQVYDDVKTNPVVLTYYVAILWRVAAELPRLSVYASSACLSFPPFFSLLCWLLFIVSPFLSCFLFVLFCTRVRIHSDNNSLLLVDSLFSVLVSATLGPVLPNCVSASQGLHVPLRIPSHTAVVKPFLVFLRLSRYLIWAFLFCFYSL